MSNPTANTHRRFGIVLRPGRFAAALHALPLALALLLLPACGTPQRGPAVPHELQDRALVPGFTPAARTWAAELNPDFYAAVIDSVARERADLAAQGHTGPLPPANFLAISGGGADGAFGAGLLCGWTARGDRPTFKLVTGISTGALIAPFAFLGPKYDYVLRDVYTRSTTKDIMNERSLLGGILSDGMADTTPLWKLLERYFDETMLDEIAAEYRKGRLLVIGTTNLDARRAVLWNIGAIAASDAPDRLPLVRSILVASASIPGAFPPVMLDVEVDGNRFQEMHVDGGAMTQVFVYPPSLKLADVAQREQIQRERHIYIIRNARIDPEWSQVERRTLSIAQRAISSLIATQGVGDLFRIYVGAQRDGVDFNLAFIPPSFNLRAREPFDPVYMAELFEVGRGRAVNGYPWEKAPPYFESAPIAAPTAADPRTGSAAQHAAEGR